MQREVSRILHDAVVDRAFLGAAVMICNSDEVLCSEAAGKSGLGDADMSTDTVAAIMSMTKAITGAAAMQLVERGQLQLDAPAGEVCPYLGEVQVLTGYDDNGEPQLRAPRQPVTLRHLLTHSSGFVYDMWNADFREYARRTATPSLGSLQKRALAVPLMFDPGSRWEYGIGIDWAGQMVEQASGMTLGEYFAEHLTGPLGMTDTAFAPTDAMRHRMSTIQSRSPDGSLQPIPSPLESDGPAPEFEMGGGGLLSTAQDYARFLRLILRDGELDGRRLLQPETVRLMSSNAMGDLRVTKLITTTPELTLDAEFFPGEPKSWGLTFQINERPAFTGRPAGTLMWAGLTNCYYWIDRRNDLAGVFVCQLFPFVDPQALSAYYQIEQAAYRHAGAG